MDIGDIEYTRLVTVDAPTQAQSAFTDVNFALGIQIRPLMVRTQAMIHDLGVTTGTQYVAFENGSAVQGGLSLANLRADNRILPLQQHQIALATNGMANKTDPWELLWWKLLLPDVRIHYVDSAAAASACQVLIHYRFATLTDGEIVELAAQRAQS